MSSTSGAGATGSGYNLLSSELFNVGGMVVVVTGGGTGIGLMITQALAVNGAKVYITGRRQRVLDTAVHHYSKKGSPHAGEIIGIRCDVTNKGQLKELADEIMTKEVNGVHLLVNNAGVALESGTTKVDVETGENTEVDYKNHEALSRWLLRAEHDKWRQTFDTNVAAQFLTAATFLPHLGLALKKNPNCSPSIINIASISGYTKSSSRGQFAYACSKASSLHLTVMLATTLLDANVRVNCIAPGIFPSEMTTKGSDEKNKSHFEKTTHCPAVRPGKDEDIAAAVLYLAGPGGAYLNGQVLHPDGGVMLTTPTSM